MNVTERTTEVDKIGTQFDQFIIAVNGALIAYAFKQVEDKVFNIYLIPLGIAILFWGLSFYFGISSIRKLISTRLIDIFRDSNDFISLNSENSNIFRNAFNKIGNLANSYNKKMFTFLYLGGCSYLIWQIIEMYLRTIKV